MSSGCFGRRRRPRSNRWLGSEVTVLPAPPLPTAFVALQQSLAATHAVATRRRAARWRAGGVNGVTVHRHLSQFHPGRADPAAVNAQS